MKMMSAMGATKLYLVEKMAINECDECGSSKVGYDKGIKFCRECGIVVEED